MILETILCFSNIIFQLWVYSNNSKLNRLSLIHFHQYIYLMMYSIERCPKGKIDRCFMPNQINPKAILKAIKVQQQKYSPTKYNNQLTIEKIHEETLKLNILRVNGRQFNSTLCKTDSRIRSKTRELNLRKVKALTSQPITKIMQFIRKDNNSSEYEQQLMNLYKLKHTASVTTNIDRESLQFSQSFSGVKEEDNIQQYEKMIVNNPILYKKIMCAYKNTRRQLDKQARENTMRKHSIPRQNTGQIRRFFKKQEPSIKSLQEQKKNTAISQYRQFLLLINASNCQVVIPSTENTYKCFIGKGNNGALVKNMIKTRPWWTIKTFSQVDSCNLAWTQWKKTRLTNNLKQVDKAYASNIKPLGIVQQNCFTVSSKNVQVAQKSKKKYEQVIKLVKILPFFANERIISNSTVQQYFCFTKKLQPLKSLQQHAQKYIRQLKTVVQMNRKQQNRVLNHIPGCLHFHSKKLLYLNLKRYYRKINKQLEDAIPETYLISKSQGDQQFLRFVQEWQKATQRKDKGKNTWICKPGENSNRGNGIVVLNSLLQIRNLVKTRTCGNKSTVILQKYMENPLLYNRRKFDFRCFILITSVNGIMKGYWYNDAYVRTASKQFSLKNLDNKFIHLTNDAIQKKGEQYGKFESNNKVTLQDFQKYLTTIYGDTFSFTPIFSKMKQIATDLIKSVGQRINSHRKQYCFQLFGLDFMIDDKLKPYLIQANSNPCLQVDGPVLSRIIPTLIQNTLRISVDPIFPPPFSENSKMSKFQINNAFQHNKFQLIYDSFYDQLGCNTVGQQQKGEISDAEMQQFEDQDINN